MTPRKLSPEDEALIEAAIETDRKRRERQKKQKLVRGVQSECLAQGLKPPSRKAILARLTAFLARNEAAMENDRKRRERQMRQKLAREVQSACPAGGLKPPSQKALLARLTAVLAKME